MQVLTDRSRVHHTQTHKFGYPPATPGAPAAPRVAVVAPSKYSSTGTSALPRRTATGLRCPTLRPRGARGGAPG